MRPALHVRVRSAEATKKRVRRALSAIAPTLSAVQIRSNVQGGFGSEGVVRLCVVVALASEECACRESCLSRWTECSLWSKVQIQTQSLLQTSGKQNKYTHGTPVVVVCRDPKLKIHLCLA